MTDVREQILARLLEVVAAIPGIRSAYRNNVDLTSEQLPAVIVFDSDEETLTADFLSKHPPGSNSVVQMTPEIVIAEQTVGQVGSALSVMRRELIKGVLFDPQLIQIVRPPNGTIYYLNCQTDVGWMRSMHGALLAHFVFKYSLKPADL